MKFYEKIILFLLTFMSGTVFAQAPYVTVWKTDNTGATAGDQIQVPAFGDFIYMWEEVGNPGNAGGGTRTGTGHTTPSITFPAPGTYRLFITPDPASSTPFDQIFFSGTGDCRKLLDIEQWGDVVWSSFDQAYSGCNNLTLTAADAPDLSQVTAMTGAFASTTSLSGAGLIHWDVSHITDMQAVFFRSVFNQPIGGWDVSNVTQMSFMFSENPDFNQDISGWQTGNVINTGSMFYLTPAFNQPIGTWDVSSVLDMSGMFNAAVSFNQDISGWDVSSATFMGSMFQNATAFNRDIGGWNVSSAEDMTDMFNGATAFDHNLGAWNLQSLTSAIMMLYYSGLSCTHYSNTLTGWAANPDTPAGIDLLMVEPLVYGHAGQAARNLLIANGWSFSDDTFDPTCDAPLPVKLISFEARKQDHYTLLTWRTASETNNRHFEVEHSQDARHFTPLGKVEGKGTTQTEKEYTWLHPNPAQGLNYYRLKQVDYDGTSEYSVIRAVNADGVFVIYPNPAQDYVVLGGVAGASTVEIVDMRGMVKIRRSHVKETEITIDTSLYAQGTYVVRMVKDGQAETRKISIKQ